MTASAWENTKLLLPFRKMRKTRVGERALIILVPRAILSEALTKRNAALGTRMAVVMLVARRLSPKRYANFAKSVVDHLEHLALYHLM